VSARLADGANPDSRTGVGSANWLSDLLGWTGKAASVHVGDVHNHATIDLSQHVHLEGDDRAKLDAWEERFGVR